MIDYNELSKNLNEIKFKASRNMNIEKPSNCMNDVNNELECLLMLKNLNDTIHFLYDFSDTEYWKVHRWNIDVSSKKLLDKYNDDYFWKLIEDFEYIRSVLVGKCLEEENSKLKSKSCDKGELLN